MASELRAERMFREHTSRFRRVGIRYFYQSIKNVLHRCKHLRTYRGYLCEQIVK